MKLLDRTDVRGTDPGPLLVPVHIVYRVGAAERAFGAVLEFKRKASPK